MLFTVANMNMNMKMNDTQNSLVSTVSYYTHQTVAKPNQLSYTFLNQKEKCNNILYSSYCAQK